MAERISELKDAHAANDHTCVIEITIRDVLMLDADDRLTDAIDELREHGRAFAVAVDGLGRPLGIVTLADALRSLADDDGWEVRPRDELAVPRRRGRTELLGFGFHLEPPDVGRVRDIVQPTLAIPMDTSIARTAAALAYEGIGRAVVTNHEIVCGVVSWEEILRWVAQHASDSSEEIHDVDSRTRDRARHRPSDPHGRIVKPKGVVIVIEDDSDVATSMAEVLHDEGYGVIATPNGREALEVLRALPTPPGIILLDLMMPEMNGWEFRDAQVQDESLATIPVVIMTAHADRFDRDELHRPSALLRKPLSTDVLVDAVTRHYRVVN